MTTDEMLRKQVEHTCKIHQMEHERLKKEKEGSWNWIKREIFLAEELTNKELLILVSKYTVSVPFIIGGTWLLFAILYALTGVR